MAMMLALSAAPPQSTARDGLITARTVQESWSQPAVSMKTPNTQYSWKCEPATVKWMTAAAALAIARQYATSRAAGSCGSVLFGIPPLSAQIWPPGAPICLGSRCDPWPARNAGVTAIVTASAHSQRAGRTLG